MMALPAADALASHRVYRLRLRLIRRYLYTDAAAAPSSRALQCHAASAITARPLSLRYLSEYLRAKVDATGADYARLSMGAGCWG